MKLQLCNFFSFVMFYQFVIILIFYLGFSKTSFSVFDLRSKKGALSCRTPENFHPSILMPKMDNFLRENHQGSLLSAFNVNVVDIPKDLSLACLALF